MGNIIPNTALPQVGSVVTVVHNKYTKENNVGSDVLRLGQKAQVLKTGLLYQSRPDAPKLGYCKLRFKNGEIDAYPASNVING